MSKRHFMSRLVAVVLTSCVVAMLTSPAAAASTSARTAVSLTCSGPSTSGDADITIERSFLHLACAPVAPVAIGDPNLIGDPSIMPWTVRLSVRDASGSSTTCAIAGVGLPARAVCPGISNPEQLVIIDLQQAP
jgi:hypothetical protein